MLKRSYLLYLILFHYVKLVTTCRMRILEYGLRPVKSRYECINVDAQPNIPILPALNCSVRFYRSNYPSHRLYARISLRVLKLSVNYLMSTINCCSFQRSSSPDLPNSRFIQTPLERDNASFQQLDPIPFVTPASTMGSAQSREIRELFTSSQDDDTRGRSISIRRRKYRKRELPATVRHKESSSRLPNLAERLKRKMSRESGLSKKGSRMRLKQSPSDEDIQHRQELKRALHQRLQEDLLRDRSASQGGYDEDAMPIATPHPTLGRSGGFEHTRPEDGPRALTLFDPSFPSDRKFSSQSRPEKYSPKVTTIQDGLTVRKVLRKKKSAPAIFLIEQHPPDTAVEPEIRLAPGQSTSPFHFNNLIIPKRSRLSLRKAPVETAKGHSAPRRPSIRVEGASGVFGRSTPNMRLQFGRAGKSSRQLSHRFDCNPAGEEMDFGGVDGAADGRNCVTAPIEQKPISGQEIQATQHTATKPIRVSQSLSQLAESSGQWHRRRTSSVYSRQLTVHRNGSQYSALTSVGREADSRKGAEAQRNEGSTNLHTNNALQRRNSPQHVASSVYSSYNDSRQSIPHLDGNRKPCTSGRRQSTAYDHFNTENKEVTLLWERAFHAEEDATTSDKKRRTSMLPRGKDSMAVRRQASVSRATGSATPKLVLPETRNQRRRPALRRLDKYSSSSIGSLSPSGREEDPTSPTNSTGEKGRDTSPVRSSGSWSRFPSHTRAERSSSPASSSDGVQSRDFAIKAAGKSNPSDKPFVTHAEMDKRKSRSLNFRKSITNTLGRLYRSQVDMRGFDKGHRSSISEGGVLEYPELELPAGLGGGGASVWSKMYEDCVGPRDAIDESSAAAVGLRSPR